METGRQWYVGERRDGSDKTIHGVEAGSGEAHIVARGV